MKRVLHLLKSNNNWFMNHKNNVETGYTFSGKITNLTHKKFHNNSEVLPNNNFLTEGNLKEEVNISTFKKVANKKYALLLSYFGDHYYGIQRSDGLKTIEDELFKALYKAGAIKAEELEEPYLVQFQITARTDKGVSAAKQVVSLKMDKSPCIKTVNEYLPEDIRLLAITRVTKGFIGQKLCTARTYSYTLPTFALAPELHTEYPESYRISKENLQKVNELLLSYVGTRNFHNFTSKKNYDDPSAKRHIMHFRTEHPFVQGIEFVTLTIKGHSFMLYQIRKIVGHLIGTLKGLTPPNMQHEVWTEKKFSVPKAPGLGLVLENIHFDWYNKKYGANGIHRPLAWEEFEDDVQSFRKEIISRIIKKEIEEKLMFQWIQFISEKNFEFCEDEFKKKFYLAQTVKEQSTSN